MDTETPDYLSTGRLAELFQVHPRQIAAFAVAAGVRPGLRLDDVDYYRAEDVTRMLAEAKARKVGRWSE